MSHRVIYCLRLVLDRDQELIIPLDRRGLPDEGCPNGWPRRPKRRTVDLRAGDFVLCEGRWRQMLEIAAYRWHWLSKQAAKDLPVDVGGYVYRVTGDPPRTTLGPGGLHRPLGTDSLRKQE